MALVQPILCVQSIIFYFGISWNGLSGFSPEILSRWLIMQLVIALRKYKYKCDNTVLYHEASN